MKPGEKRDMAVVFYVDPKLAKNSELDDLNTITLSYTFYPVRAAGHGRWRRAVRSARKARDAGSRAEDLK